MIAFGELVDAHDVGAGLEQFLLAVGDGHLDDVAGVDESADVLAGAENRGAAVVALVASHPFEHRQAVVQAVGEDVNGGLVVRHHRAVHPDSIGAQIVRGHSGVKSNRWAEVSRWVPARYRARRGRHRRGQLVAASRIRRWRRIQICRRRGATVARAAAATPAAAAFATGRLRGVGDAAVGAPRSSEAWPGLRLSGSARNRNMRVGSIE